MSQTDPMGSYFNLSMSRKTSAISIKSKEPLYSSL